MSFLDCQYGERYWKERKKSNKRLRLQNSRKIGCHAHIMIHTYTLYPDFQIKMTNLSQYKLRQEKEDLLQSTRSAIKDGKAKPLLKYHVSLPTSTVHSGHPVGSAASFCQRVHPTIIKKISELVSTGIIETKEVQKALYHYVKHDLPRERGITPLTSDRAFYPLPNDIKNHVGTAKSALDLSKLDQENLRLKVEEWHKTSPQSSHYFRPFIKPVLEDLVLSGKKSVANHVPGTYVGKSGCSDEWVRYEGVSERCKQTLLWIHQENWQKDLLVKYGNTMTLIDATYKTTRYDLALFFLCVRTNVNYTVVAEFIIQSESAEQIAEALSIIKDWNPKWSPPFFMSDYSEAEQLAINTVFPHCTVYLCDFHREQAWERWVKNHNHGLNKDEAETLLHLLRDCAHAPSPKQQESLPVDHYYQIAVKKLKESPVWINNAPVSQWLTSKWLNIPQVREVHH